MTALHHTLPNCSLAYTTVLGLISPSSGMSHAAGPWWVVRILGVSHRTSPGPPTSHHWLGSLMDTSTSFLSWGKHKVPPPPLHHQKHPGHRVLHLPPSSISWEQQNRSLVQALQGSCIAGDPTHRSQRYLILPPQTGRMQGVLGRTSRPRDSFINWAVMTLRSLPTLPSFSPSVLLIKPLNPIQHLAGV